jgi:hypothetical protein
LLVVLHLAVLFELRIVGLSGSKIHHRDHPGAVDLRTKSPKEEEMDKG